LRSVGVAHKDEALARTVVMVLIGWCVWVGAAILAFVVVFVAMWASVFGDLSSGSASGAATSIGIGATFAIGEMALVGLAYIGLYVRYLLVATQVRELVERRLRKM
jgi:hypothetical protein